MPITDHTSPPTLDTTMPAAPSDPQPAKPRYLEVWGDTVVGRDLALAVLIGTGFSALALFGAKTLFGRIVANPSLADAYALLVGIAACIVAGVISGKLFAPKRKVVVAASDAHQVDEVLAVLADERQGLGHVADLPAQTADELRDLGLYDRFRAAEGKRR
ncbi:MAG TPA: hypothetical protein VIW24_08955 [Aldersonia sp.]